MKQVNTKLAIAVETYFADLARIYASGGAIGERSSYGPLANLFNAVGATLKPKVFCVGELADQGAGHPDFGLYAAHQVQRGRPRQGQVPERGVVEVKPPDEDTGGTVIREQVVRYRRRYDVVMVTNLRAFALVVPDDTGGERTLGTFVLAASADEFARKLEKPRAFAGEAAAGLVEYLARALSHRAALAEPKDLAWLLASYARDGLARVEAAGDAPLADTGDERPGVFLTNALTGWEPRTTKPLPFPELEEERDRAEKVKQETPILVILGNPPYNGFAGMAVDEERALSDAYRTTRRVRKPEGQGLNDLYVRFFRMAERRIAEKTGQGVVCFISNYSWLDGLSFTGMRERYLEAFDAIRIDCLNGDKYKTGKVAPDGSHRTRAFSRRKVTRSVFRSAPPS